MWVWSLVPQGQAQGGSLLQHHSAADIIGWFKHPHLFKRWMYNLASHLPAAGLNAPTNQSPAVALSPSVPPPKSSVPPSGGTKSTPSPDPAESSPSLKKPTIPTANTSFEQFRKQALENQERVGKNGSSILQTHKQMEMSAGPSGQGVGGTEEATAAATAAAAQTC